MFEVTKPSLYDLLKAIQEGGLQLPDFQRGWVWDDDRIKALLASVSRSFPIGAVMLLERGGDTKSFKPRPVEGADTDNINPDSLILDGQQRLTALFQSLKSDHVVETQDVRTKKKLKRWYYIDMKKAVDPQVDREDAIISLSEEKTVLNFRGEITADYRTPEAEYEAHLFPLSQVFDVSAWRYGYNSYWKRLDQSLFFDEFEKVIIESFRRYHLPVIQLFKSTLKEAVCMVFEKVNTGGVPLTVFELITATYAADNFELRKDWEKREKRLSEHNVLKSLPSDNFLQALTLVATYYRRKMMLQSAVACKRKDILNLELKEYTTYAEAVTQGFIWAAGLLRDQKIFDARDIPYATQLVPLAAVYALLGKPPSNDMRKKLLQWYWCGVFGELYSSSVETRFARDVIEILAWLDGGSEPSTVIEADFNAQRFLTLTSRNSAAYKGLSALIMQTGGRDFYSGQDITEQLYSDSNIDIHHIFSPEWCSAEKVDRYQCNSIVNKTPLSARTKRSMGNKKPGDYLKLLEKDAGGSEELEDILKSHVIDSQALKANNFETFFNARRQSLIQKIEQAMGKSIRY